MGDARTGNRPPAAQPGPITGAGGTADIKGSHIRGAHGPRHLHTVLAEG